MTAQRIQLRRTKGWRKQDGAVVVARPTRWGNPWRIVYRLQGRWFVHDARTGPPAASTTFVFDDRRRAAEYAVRRFREDLLWTGSFRPLSITVDDVHAELAGRDLACWCAPDWPCHADVLLEVANNPEPTS